MIPPNVCFTVPCLFTFSGSLKMFDILNIVNLEVVAKLLHHVGEGGVLA